MQQNNIERPDWWVEDEAGGRGAAVDRFATAVRSGRRRALLDSAPVGPVAAVGYVVLYEGCAPGAGGAIVQLMMRFSRIPFVLSDGS